jgi:hypothetical protein
MCCWLYSCYLFCFLFFFPSFFHKKRKPHNNNRKNYKWLIIFYTWTRSQFLWWQNFSIYEVGMIAIIFYELEWVTADGSAVKFYGFASLFSYTGSERREIWWVTLRALIEKDKVYLFGKIHSYLPLTFYLRRSSGEISDIRDTHI